MPQIFDPEKCSNYLENKICRYCAKGKEKHFLGEISEIYLEYLDTDKMGGKAHNSERATLMALNLSIVH